VLGSAVRNGVCCYVYSTDVVIEDNCGGG
jgi:hypothetical protein